jgi:hypothetical protein
MPFPGIENLAKKALGVRTQKAKPGDEKQLGQSAIVAKMFLF